MKSTQNNNSQIDKYIKPMIKSYLTSVSNNEYGLSNIGIRHINRYLQHCSVEDMKGISDLYQKLRTASWSKDVEMMHFLIKCIEESVIKFEHKNA